MLSSEYNTLVRSIKEDPCFAKFLNTERSNCSIAIFRGVPELVTMEDCSQILCLPDGRLTTTVQHTTTRKVGDETVQVTVTQSGSLYITNPVVVQMYN